MTNGRHKNDELVDENEKNVSKTGKIGKINKNFQKTMVGIKGNKNIDCQKFVLLLFRFFKF